MKDKITALINRQLGELPEENSWWCENCKMEVEQLHVTYSECHDICGCYVQGTENYREVEQSRRELLAALISIVYDDYSLMVIEAIKLGRTKEYAKDSIMGCDNILRDNILLIEKSLNMKWPDIVSFLEGGE